MNEFACQLFQYLSLQYLSITSVFKFIFRIKMVFWFCYLQDNRKLVTYATVVRKHNGQHTASSFIAQGEKEINPI